MPSDDPTKNKAKKLGDFTDEELANTNPTSLMFSIALAEVINVAYYAGVERKILHEAVDELYDAISEMVKEKAN